MRQLGHGPTEKGLGGKGRTIVEILGSLTSTIAKGRLVVDKNRGAVGFSNRPQGDPAHDNVFVEQLGSLGKEVEMNGFGHGSSLGELYFQMMTNRQLR